MNTAHYFRNTRRTVAIVLLLIFVAGFFLPEAPHIPVSRASHADWNQQSFWYYPWGRSGVHKGIDIFAPEGTPVIAATSGLVIRTGADSLGGNVIAVLGAKWRIHYYAHLQQISTTSGSWVTAGETIGAVGTTGNAQGKPPHLHYSILSLYPQLWLFNPSLHQPLRRLFFVDPNLFLSGQ